MYNNPLIGAYNAAIQADEATIKPDPETDLGEIYRQSAQAAIDALQRHQSVCHYLSAQRSVRFHEAEAKKNQELLQTVSSALRADPGIGELVREVERAQAREILGD